MKVAIAGGGTGGHLFPALAVAEVLRERGDDVLVFISEKEVDALATQGHDDLRFEKLPSIGMPRLLSPAILGFLWRFNNSLSPCRALYREFQPDAVLGMGGFTSTAPILAGRLRKIPTFVHESNAIPGKANRLNARLVTAVLLGFSECTKHFPNARCEVTGTPIRRSLVDRMPRAEALAHFGLEAGKRTLLVMGGSQGAHGINEALARACTAIKELDLQIIHLTGPQDDQLMTDNYRRAGIPAHVAPFCHRMDAAYAAADAAIARSGAASLTELSHFALPSVLIPYPHAAENHQALNAEIFVRSGAASVLDQSQTTGETLAAALREMLAPARFDAMQRSARSLAPRDAARQVVATMEKYL